MAALDVCIITASHLGSTPRVVKEADALQAAGLSVKVIAIRTLDSVEVRDQAVLHQAGWTCERVDLRTRLRRWPNRLVELAARRTFEVTRSASVAEVALSSLTPFLKRAALRTPAALYIAHYPPALAAASGAADRHRARLSFDAEDFHLGDWPHSPCYELDRSLLTIVERRYLPRCAHVTAASPGIAAAYADAYGIAAPKVILNTFPLARAPMGPTPCGSASPGPSVYWFSQVVGPDRGLECAVKAIGRAGTRPHLYLRGTPAPGYRDLLLQIASEVGATDRVHFLEPEMPNRMELLASAYDIGLVAETGQTRNRQIALTNKFFSYLLAGIPAAMTDIAAHRAFARETGLTDLLFAIDDPVSLAAVLDRILGDRHRLATARHIAHRLGRERYNWEADSVSLVETVRQSLKASAS